MQDFRIRASAAGQIMSNPKKGVTGLSEKCKTYLTTWYKEQLYSRRKEFTSKHTAKGNYVEDAAIQFAAEHFGWGEFVDKNQKHYEDTELTGTPDLLPVKDLVVDIKCSWDCFTFPLLETELPTDDYYWQIQTYLALTNRSMGMIVYCLMNAPEFIVEQEAWKIARSNGESEIDMHEYDRILANMTYTNLPDNLRIKAFEIQRNDADIMKLRARVLECREYIATELMIPERIDIIGA